MCGFASFIVELHVCSEQGPVWIIAAQLAESLSDSQKSNNRIKLPDLQGHLLPQALHC